MRLKLDENIDARLAFVLCDAGHDAVAVREQDLHGTDDIDLYQLCISENRALVTLDQDFSNVLRYPPESTPGQSFFEARRISLPPSGFSSRP